MDQPQRPAPSHGPSGGKVQPTRELYQALGLATVPLQPHGKAPTVQRWTNPSPAAWEGAPANANVGIVTGEPSMGLAVVDIDDPAKLDHVFGMAVEEILAKTWVVETARGLHVYAWAGHAASMALPDGAGDLKAHGGLVVAPPSVHPSGQRYRFIHDHARDANLDGGRIATRIASDALGPIPELDVLAPLFETRDPGEGPRSPEAAPREGPCVGAKLPAHLEDRVQAFIKTQSPSFQRTVQDMRRGRAEDRSGAEFVLALGLFEAGFSRLNVARVLQTWGPKTKTRGRGYLERTLAAAKRQASGSGGRRR